ncbi:MAG: hypothetical protein HJJLKODD_02347 [Phycisphaerae bacterium]|nr:hypothetical protein [Phycisphaerae bacterium]
MARPVLHITLESDRPSQAMSEQLAKLTLAEERRTDCYLGLAEVVRRGVEGWCTVLVNLGGLHPGDQEFLQFMNRRFRALAVYVYGTESSEVTREWAMAAGAREYITPKQLAGIAEQWRMMGEVEGSETVERLDSSRLTDLLVEEIIRPVESAIERPRPSASKPTRLTPLSPVVTPEEEDLLTQRQRVRRQKQSTPRMTSSSPAVPAEEQFSAPELSTLLTEEELRALLSEPIILQEQPGGRSGVTESEDEG